MEPNLNCRMYSNEFPEVGDIVTVNVTKVDMGVYVDLREYNDIEGLIPLSEMARKRIKTLTQLTSVGKQEIACVTDVNKEKGYVELSKRSVTPEEYDEQQVRFKEACSVQSLMKFIASTLHTDLEEVHQLITWPLYEKHESVYKLFKNVAKGQQLEELDELNLEDDVLQLLIEQIIKKMPPDVHNVTARFDLTNYGYEGIDAIKNLLKNTLQKYNAKKQIIKINLYAAPTYIMSSTSIEKEDTVAVMNDALEYIKEGSKQFKGIFNVVEEPKY